MKKINYYELPLEKDLEGKNFVEGLQLLGLTNEDFELNVGSYGECEQNTMTDLDYTFLIVDEELEEEMEMLITYTISDEIGEDNDREDIEKMNGYWHYSV